MNATQQMDMFGTTADLFAEPVPAPVAAPTRTGPDLAGELMAIMQRHLAVSIFKLGDVHYHYTGRCHHQCELWREMDRLEDAGKVRCDFSTGERVWHLS